MNLNKPIEKRGRRKLNPLEDNKYIGFRCPESKAKELDEVSKRMGLSNISSLIRSIVETWLIAYKKQTDNIDK